MDFSVETEVHMFTSIRSLYCNILRVKFWIPGAKSVDDLADRLGQPRELVRKQYTVMFGDDARGMLEYRIKEGNVYEDLTKVLQNANWKSMKFLYHIHFWRFVTHPVL